MNNRRLTMAVAAACLVLGQAGEAQDARQPAFFQYLTGEPAATLVGYTPLEVDPRNPANNERVSTASLRQDLKALRPAFDGLITYGYHEASTPRVVALAKELKYRAIVLGIWQPKSAAEVDGVAELVKQFHNEMAIAVVVGNEGLTFGRYEEDDIKFAAERLRQKLPPGIPLTTSEPQAGYEREFVRNFGDFLAPNIHPVFHAPHLDAAKAAAWVDTGAMELAKQTGKVVFVKETGFPHAGKENYTPATQRDFWTAYTREPLLMPVEGQPDAYIYRGVAFEAFDLAWKSEATGLAVEKSWGLLSAERKPYPAFGVWQRVAKGE